MKIPFARPDIGQAEIDAVVRCMKSGWLTSGKVVAEFEAEFAEYLHMNMSLDQYAHTKVEAVAVSSATSGLVLALKALKVGEGDEVITTPYTFTATAEAIVRVGATPVFVDVEAGGYNINAERIEEAITLKTKAILPVHFAGQVCDMVAILSIAQKHSLMVIEDAAHALPARCQDGSLVGTLRSDATVYSFYATKPLCTGEGGMIVTRHEDVARQCRLLRLHGIDKAAADRPGWHYEVVTEGDKCNMPDTAAAMGTVQLMRLEAMHRRRLAIAQVYDRELQGLVGLPSRDAVEAHAWHLYPVRLTEVVRGEFITKMAEMGIQCGVHYIPVHLHPYWAAKYDFKPWSFPNAFHAYEQEMSLPISSGMCDEEVARVVDAVKVVLGS